MVSVDVKHHVYLLTLTARYSETPFKRSSEIQGTVLGKYGLEYNYRSMLAGVAQSRHAFVGGTVSTAWER